MAVTVTSLTRSFSYNGMELPDPGAQLSAEEVRDVYSASFPELTSASIEGPETKGNKLVYTFRRAVGTKGACACSRLRTVLKERDGLQYVEVIPAHIETLAEKVQRVVDKAVNWLDVYFFEPLERWTESDIGLREKRGS